MVEYFRVNPEYSAKLEQIIRLLAQRNGGKLSFAELEKRVNVPPPIKIIELIPNDDPKAIEFNKHLGFEVYRVVNGEVLPL